MTDASGTQEMSLPIVQFASALIYAHEGISRRSRQDLSEQDMNDSVELGERNDELKDLWNTLTIEVLRIGGVEKECEVRYSLDEDGIDAEAVKEMFTYVDESTGSLKFPKGKTSLNFSIRLVEGDDFDSVVEIPFKLEATDGCKVNEYMCRTRIKLIDDDVFPSDKFRKQLLEDYTCVAWKTGKDVQMVWEIIKLCYSLNKSGARKILIGDTISNLIFITQLKLFELVVDALSDDNNTISDTFGTVCWLAVGLTMPFAFTHAFSYSKETWKVGGKVRKEMIKDLLVRILYYRETSRDSIIETEVKETFGHHLFQVVSDIYMQSFVISAALGRIGLLSLYFSYTAIRFQLEAEEDSYSQFMFLPLFFVVPLAAIFYTRTRQNSNREVREQAEKAKMELSAFLAAVIDSFRAIADCHARPQVVASCGPKVNDMNARLVAQGKMQANDVAFFGWAREVVELCIIILGGFLVLRGVLSVGALLATLKGFTSATAQYGLIFNAALKMQGSFPAMWLLCQYMNMPMDLEERRQMQERRPDILEQIKEESKNEESSEGREFDVDDTPIRIKMDAGFDFGREPRRGSVPRPLTPPVGEGEDQECPPAVGSTGDLVSHERSGGAPIVPMPSVFKSVNLTIKQGSVVGIAGNAGSGKKTLLKVLAGVLPIRDNDVAFIPAHLRVHHLELRNTLYAALTPDTYKSESQMKGYDGYDNAVAYNVFFALIAAKGVNRISELTKEERANGLMICKKLNMDAEVVQMVEKPFMGKGYEEQAGLGLKTLPQSSRIKIQLARALVADPEVLVIHQPTEGLNEEDSMTVSDALVDFVKKSPVSQERRPRTCVFSSNRPNVLFKADIVHELKNGVCTKVSKEDLELRILHTHPEWQKIQTEVQEKSNLREEKLKAELESARAELVSAKAELESLRQELLGRELVVHQRI